METWMEKSRVKEIHIRKFKEMEGSYYCRELKGVATGTPLVPCSQCIANAVELTEQYLASEKA